MKEADTTDYANHVHLADDNDNQKDDVTLSFSNEETMKTLLFVHQTQDQRYCLERYGNKLCLLDAKYQEKCTWFCCCSLSQSRPMLITSLFVSL